MQVTDRGVNIKRVDGRATCRVNSIDELCKVHKIPSILQRAGPTPTIEVRAVLRVSNPREGYPFTANLDVVLRVSRIKK